MPPSMKREAMPPLADSTGDIVTAGPGQWQSLSHVRVGVNCSHRPLAVSMSALTPQPVMRFARSGQPELVRRPRYRSGVDGAHLLQRLRFTVRRRDTPHQSLAAPKLRRPLIHKLLRPLDGLFVRIASKRTVAREMPFRTDKVRLVLDHPKLLT